jgi:HB1, ASXL, restriction endonuclease HTH domain
MSATPQRTTSYEGKSIMAGKKKASTTADVEVQTLKIGSRVRCTDDGVEGRIVWANGVSVKITWNDGEQVTWRRDSLADRPIAILAGDDDPPAPEQAASPQAEQEVNPEATETSTLEATVPTAEPAVEPSPVQTESDAASEPTPTAGKPKRRRKDAAEPQQKKLSALDAAARVLAETGAPMGCKELIGAMAGKGYWMSPGGKTPSATLFSAIAREIAMKGDLARFTKAGPGRFGPRGA